MPAPAEFIGKRVGRFTITSHLASGGMAELFIARQEAVGGFEKQLVLKMLQERYASNPRVLQMFLDEARLAAKLNHQNIVHVYDVDRADGIHYIAMEYIYGETVTDIIRRSIAAGSFLPLEHALQIVADVAAGLAYAHESRDVDGKVTRIVHRDVSPSNVLVTYEGITKIVDFGIARVQDQIREESGMRPGKMSYMSPEQVRGEVSDHRADIYSLGIVLYEITVGRRLWRGPPEVVMKRILEEQVPPPTYIRRGYPPALELIIMKALEKRPTDRQQGAAQLQSELLEFMEESGLKSGPRRLARYMKDLFAVEAGPDASGATNSSGLIPLSGGASGAKTAAVGAPAAAEEDDEDLDFDRRAPLTMRVEARPEDRAEWESGPASGSGITGGVPVGGRSAIPTSRAAETSREVSAETTRETSRETSRSTAGVKAAPSLFPLPAAVNGEPAGGVQDLTTAGAGGAARTGAAPLYASAVPPASSDSKSAPSSLSGRTLLFFIALIAVGIVVFIATK